MEIRHLKVAVCKPDHLGDFVLALPALRRLQACGCELTLFIASGNFAIARYLMPDAELVALDMPYLRRGAPIDSWSAVYKALGRLRTYDLVFFLRRDYFFTPSNFAHWSDYSFFIEEREDLHQTQLEHAAVSQVCGPFDVESYFHMGRPMSFPTQPKRIGFAVGAGFPHKKWSVLDWANLGHHLLDREIEVELLSGPSEVAECRLIARAMGLSESKVFVSGLDFGALQDWLDGLDGVIAADGGSAHLCSLQKPVLAVFGPSPFRRYAPTGACNRVVTRDLPCSPCVGFDSRAINACLSRECLYGLPADDVLRSLFMPAGLPGAHVDLTGPAGAKVYFGVSASRIAA